MKPTVASAVLTAVVCWVWPPVHHRRHPWLRRRRSLPRLYHHRLRQHRLHRRLCGMAAVRTGTGCVVIATAGVTGSAAIVYPAAGITGTAGSPDSRNAGFSGGSRWLGGPVLAL